MGVPQRAVRHHRAALCRVLLWIDLRHARELGGYGVGGGFLISQLGDLVGIHTSVELSLDLEDLLHGGRCRAFLDDFLGPGEVPGAVGLGFLEAAAAFKLGRTVGQTEVPDVRSKIDIKAAILKSVFCDIPGTCLIDGVAV